MPNLILAVSADGHLATGPDDDMGWTGSTDKRLFKLLTSVGAVCGVGARSWQLMPELDGRRLIPLSRSRACYQKGPPAPAGPVPDDRMLAAEDLFFTVGQSLTLGEFAHRHPDGWLLGGPTLAMEALSIGLVDQVYLCRIDVNLGEGVRDEVTPWLMRQGERNAGVPWRRVHRIPFDGVTVDCWSRLDACRSGS